MRIKIYDGFFDSLYKKWELYLFRLFKLAIYCENSIKFRRISDPPLNEILNPKGYKGEILRIPPNPFFIKKEDRKIFEMFYEPLSSESDDEKGIRKLLKNIWIRIGEIKEFLGIIKNTRYIGESNPDKRLVNEIDIYMRFPESKQALIKLMFGGISIEEYKSFQRLLKDREPIKGIKSYKNYE